MSVSVTPSSATINLGATIQFQSTVSGTSNTSIIWSSSAGIITSSGLYTAPNTAGSYTVKATSVADTTRSASATVTVTSPSNVSVAITPTTASLVPSGTVAFTATVSNASSTTVTWSVSAGAISGSGNTISYIAPSTAGTYSVKATSTADTTKSASATVTVTAPPAVAVTMSPTSASLQTGGTQQFAATVTGSSNTAVNWSTTGGTVSSSGLFTAPNLAGSYTVSATSTADTTKLASATVTVTAPPAVAVTMSPTSASLQTGGTQQFAATVTGSSNTAVTWSATSGVVSSSGLYTAPGIAGTYSVKATSAADTTKSAYATVTVSAPATVAISVTPGSVLLAPNTTTSLTASVNNTTNTAVTWTSTGGTISGTGNTISYTAPATTGSYSVTATSMADTSKQASVTVADTSTRPTPSFEGYGANATGGSNVVHVTNLNSSGSGSFAAALASSGNHVVFDVAGTISGTFYIPSSTFIDGFSAPSPGILFTGGTGAAGILNVVDVNNIIIQGVRIRGSSGMADNTKGIMFYESASTNHDIVVDHCEIENVTDEDLGSSGHNVTISWNLLGAPASSGGELIKYNAYQWSIHHNLWVGFTGNDSRVPLVWAGNDSTSKDSWSGVHVADVVGNVVSQFLYGIAYVTDGADADPSNIMNNYLDGQDSSHARNGIDIMASSLEQHYIAGNASVINPSGAPSTYSCGASNICGTYSITTTNQLSGGQVSTPFAMPTITTSCVYDTTGRIAEWTNVIKNSGVAIQYADDATSSALRAVVTTPTSSTLGQSWNQQIGTCP